MTQILDNINKLPSISEIKRVSQSLALLDAIIMPEWEFRYFSFDYHWDGEEMMASMKNGSGNEYFLFFNKHGVIGKVFIGNMQLSENEKNELFVKIPSTYEIFKQEEAFSLENISFCFWRSNSDEDWVSEPIAKNLPYLNFLTGDSKIYKKWAEEYYEKEFNINVIQDIFSHKPLTNEMVVKLNTEIKIEDLEEDLEEIGYPTS